MVFLKQDIARGMIYFRDKEKNEIIEKDTFNKEEITHSFEDLKNKFGNKNE